MVKEENVIREASMQLEDSSHFMKYLDQASDHRLIMLGRDMDNSVRRIVRANRYRCHYLGTFRR